MAGETAELEALLFDTSVGPHADTRTVAVGPLLTRTGTEQHLVLCEVEALTTNAAAPGGARRFR